MPETAEQHHARAAGARGVDGWRCEASDDAYLWTDARANLAAVAAALAAEMA